MRKESANPPPPNIIEWVKIWGAALLKPTPSGFAAVFEAVQPHRATALAWLVTGGVVAAIITMITYPAPAEFVLAALACSMPFFAFLYAVLTIFTARSALWIAAQMDGSGTFDRTASFDRLFYALSAINAPMSILSALAYLLPAGYLLAYGISIYWIYLTVLAVKTLVGLTWGRAAAASAVFILASLLAVALGFGVALLPPV